MKKILTVWLLVLLIVSACACSKVEHDADEAWSGGTAIDGVNLRSISVDDGGVTIGFVTGSEKMGLAEEDVAGVPTYEVRHLDSPSRMVIAVKNVVYRDYENKTYSSNAVKGLTVRQFFDDTNTYVYINVAGDYVYTCRENMGELRIDIKLTEKETGEKYYVVADAIGVYDNYSASEVGRLTPTVSSNGKNVVMISQPFDTQEAAETEMEQLKGIYSEKIHISAYYIVKMGENDLPEYKSENEIKYLREKNVYSINGNSHSGTLMFTESRYISSPESGKFFIAVPMVVDGEMKEKLYVTDLAGKSEAVTEQTFTSIVMAEKSPSGRYIAIGEQPDSMMILSVLDTQTGMLHATSEEGLGTFSTGFAWNKQKDILYSVGGEGNFDLKSYDLEKSEISTLTESYYGSIAVLDDGRIAYLGAFDGNTHLMLRNIDGTVSSVGMCSDYQIAADGSFAVLRLNNALDEQEDDLKYVNLTNDETFMLVQGLDDLIRFNISDDGKAVIYAIGDENQSEFPVAVYRYDIAKKTVKKVLNVISEDCKVYENGKYIMNYIYIGGENAYPVVYMLDIDWEA